MPAAGPPVSPADVFVRPATPADAAAVAEVQLRVWREAYGALLPAAALLALDAGQVEARWRDAVADPPSPRHHLLVAVDDGFCVGLAAFGPAEDEGLDPATAAELLVLGVLPERNGRGHGSRLLAAAVDTMRVDGFARAVTWLFEADGALTAFLEAAGWAFDGASRDLDIGGELVHQVRLHTAL